ncbi:MAG: bifunctional DNA-formamidopyrimidine glycosylase/DNA-(apurinic or apyrimidinic site) lyase [Pseudomonadota bacterium]
MPELPEVETTLRGVSPLVTGRTVENMLVRNYSLRHPVDKTLPRRLLGQRLVEVERRAKYLFFRFSELNLIWHLGMSGSMRVNQASVDPATHDHIDVVFDNNQCLRYRDPRRFGLVLWTAEEPNDHKLIRHLGPEPWDAKFDGDYLHRLARGRKLAVKNFIMDGKIVVGVGNIYASESLHLAGIDPRRAASRISEKRFARLVVAIREVLDLAIAKGGTTLRDFAKTDGQPGYFRHELNVYDRAGEACHECGALIKQIVIGQRSSYYCPNCQR